MPRRLRRKLGSLGPDDRGAVVLELLIWLPVLIALVVVVVEAGRTLLAHDVMVNGVRNATRYLSRVPFDDLATELPNAQCVALTGVRCADGGTSYGFWTDPSSVTLDPDPPTMVDPGPPDGVFRTVVYELVVRAEADFSIPFLGWLNILPGFRAYATVVEVGARDRARHFGD
jgi:hypothetical protein